ncbi:MAG: CdaR family protein [Bacteroidales bacterium]
MQFLFKPFSKIYSVSPSSRKKIYIFLLCLLFSFISWLFTKLSGETNTTLPVEINVVNTPREVVFVQRSDSVFFIESRATGLKILNHRLTNNIKGLNIDFYALQKMMRNEQSLYYYTANQMEMRFSMVSNFSRNALTAKPDTIFFLAREASSKKIPVKPNTEITFRPGFGLYEKPLLQPDSVTIYAPENITDTIHFIETQPLKAENLSKDLHESLRIKSFPVQSGIHLSHEEVNVTLRVEEYTESMLELPLTIKRCVDLDTTRTEILLFPEKVAVYYLIALKDANKLNHSMLEVSVECPEASLLNANRLSAEVTKKPEWIEVLRVKPAEVEFVLIEKQ